MTPVYALGGGRGNASGMQAVVQELKSLVKLRYEWRNLVGAA